MREKHKDKKKPAKTTTKLLNVSLHSCCPFGRLSLWWPGQPLLRILKLHSTSVPQSCRPWVLLLTSLSACRERSYEKVRDLALTSKRGSVTSEIAFTSFRNINAAIEHTTWLTVYPCPYPLWLVTGGFCLFVFVCFFCLFLFCCCVFCRVRLVPDKSFVVLWVLLVWPVALCCHMRVHRHSTAAWPCVHFLWLPWHPASSVSTFGNATLKAITLITYRELNALSAGPDWWW